MAEHDVKVKRGTSFTVFCRPRTGSAAAPQAGDSLGTGGKEAGARGEGSRGETATVRKGIGAAFLRGQPRCRRAPRPNGRSTPGHTEQGPARRRRRAPGIPGSSPSGRAGPGRPRTPVPPHHKAKGPGSPDPSRHSPTGRTQSQLPPQLQRTSAATAL